MGPDAKTEGWEIMNHNVFIPWDRLTEFCRANSITWLAIFGSALRDDFGPESDVDVLVRFEEEARHTLFDLSRMEAELKAIFGREIDLVSRHGVERSRNYIRRRSILQTAEVVYAA